LAFGRDILDPLWQSPITTVNLQKNIRIECDLAIVPVVRRILAVRQLFQAL
jgi:hypothetical protein